MKRISDFYLLNRYIILIFVILIITMFIFAEISVGIIIFINIHYPEFLICLMFIITYIIFFDTLDFYNQSLVEINARNEIQVTKGRSKFILYDSDVSTILIKKIRNFRSGKNRYKIRIKTQKYGDICFLCNDKNLQNENTQLKLWNNYSWNKVIYK